VEQSSVAANIPIRSLHGHIIMTRISHFACSASDLHACILCLRVFHNNAGKIILVWPFKAVPLHPSVHKIHSLQPKRMHCISSISAYSCRQHLSRFSTLSDTFFIGFTKNERYQSGSRYNNFSTNPVSFLALRGSRRIGKISILHSIPRHWIIQTGIGAL
jgi:hypothetical protein